MPQYWNTYKLEELGTIARGKSKHRPRDAAHLYGGKYPFIQTGDVKAANHRLNSHTQTYSEAGLSQSKLWPKDTMCITIAANIAETAILEYPACFPDSIIGFIADNKVCDIDFVEYLMQYFKKQIQSHSIGSVQDNINLATFQRVEFLVPPLPIQRRIASILWALDDKIELNLEMNKTLEEMTMALYKHWFVDFGPFQDGNFVDSELGMIPEGWEVFNLNKIAYKKSETYDFNGKEKVIFINTGDVLEGEFLHNDKSIVSNLPGQAKKSIERGDILYSEIRPKNKRFAFVNFDASEYVVSTKFMVIKPTEKTENRLLYRILRRQKTIDEFNSIAEGRSGTFPQITFDAISDFQVVLPNIEIQQAFQKVVEPMEILQENIHIENKILRETRDILLPKLISGEIEVKKAEEVVSKVV